MIFVLTIRVSSVDDRVLNARGIVLRVERAGVVPAGLLQRIGELMSNLIVKSSSSSCMLSEL